MATTKTRKKKTTKAERRAIALRNLKKARAAVKKKTAKKSTTAKKTRKAPKKAAKSRAKSGGLEPMKRGSGYGPINTLVLTPAQATALGKLMRSHRCKGKDARTVCVTKKNRVVAVISPNR